MVYLADRCVALMILVLKIKCYYKLLRQLLIPKSGLIYFQPFIMC